MPHIALTVGIYFVNHNDFVYNKRYVKLAIQKLMTSLRQPHTVTDITVKNIYKISLLDLKPLTRDLNIVIIPSRAFHFDLMGHSDKTVLILALDAGNPKYSHGIYCQPLTLVRRFLGGEEMKFGNGSMYFRMKPEGKAIIAACAVNFPDLARLQQLYKSILRIKLTSKQRFALMRAIDYKRQLLKLALQEI